MCQHAIDDMLLLKNVQTSNKVIFKLSTSCRLIESVVCWYNFQ